MMRHLFAAIQFLTIVPAPSAVDPARAAALFPLVGALIGAAGGALALGAAQWFPPQMAALLGLALMVTITGGLHEDGTADVFDAFRAGRAPEKIHDILKDSRIGTYGASALILTLALRWQALAALGPRSIIGMAAAAGAARGVIIVLARVARPAGSGLGRAFHDGLSTAGVIVAALSAAALPFLCGPKAGAAALAANALLVIAARRYFHARIDGVTGDCLGATGQLAEIATLLIFVCPLSI